MHESGSYDHYRLGQPDNEGWSLPLDPQVVPPPRTGTGYAVGPTLSIPAVPETGAHRYPMMSAGESYSTDNTAADPDGRAAPPPRPQTAATQPFHARRPRP